MTMMPDDTLARIVNETRRTFAHAYERPSEVPSWEERHPRQQELDRHIAVAVEGAVRNQVAAELQQLALHQVPGIVREALREAARAVLRGHKDCSDEKGER